MGARALHLDVSIRAADAANAHAAFLAGKRRFPTFEARRRDRARFAIRAGLALEVGRVRPATYGWVRIAAACQAQAKLRRLVRRGHATLQHVTVTKHSDGQWYATPTFNRTGADSCRGAHQVRRAGGRC